MIVLIILSCLLFILRWYFAVISVSGVFAVTFSVVFAYVADITQEHERSMAYGLVCILIPSSSLCAAAECLVLSAKCPFLQEVLMSNHSLDCISESFQGCCGTCL